MMMRQEEVEALQKVFPFAPLATSYGMGWKGLQAVRYHKSHIGELSAAGTAKTHVLVLTIQPSERTSSAWERSLSAPASPTKAILPVISKEFSGYLLRGCLSRRRPKIVV